ncbi:MAG: Asp23/Gls24 family envelope stress response protein [Rubrobacteraceae bacterium]
MTETEQQEQRQKESPLYSERGTTKISDTIVSQIIDRAVNDIEGIRPGKTKSQVGDFEVAVDFNMEMEYGRDLTALTSALRTRISEEIRRMTGLQVIEQNIIVTDVFFTDSGNDEHEEEDQPAEDQEEEETRVS